MGLIPYDASRGIFRYIGFKEILRYKLGAEKNDFVVGAVSMTSMFLNTINTLHLYIK